MKTYCVTGGAGFIGSHLCERLLALGHRVVCIDNFNDAYDYRIKIRNILNSTGSLTTFQFTGKETDLLHLQQAVRGDSFKLVVADIRHVDELVSAFGREQIDAVIHLAAMAGVRPSIEEPLLYEDVNVKGTLTVLEAMRRQGIRKWLCASSSSVYGNNAKVPFAEEDIVDRSISPYAATKKACEVLGHAYYHLHGIDTVMLRFFTVYGERQRPDLAIHKFVGMLERGEPLTVYGNGSSRRDYTYIGDIVNGLVGALAYVESEEKVYEIVNLGTNRTISLLELIRGIEQAYGKEAELRWLANQPGDVEQTYADISKANRLFGYDPQTDFAEGLHKFVNWYRGNRYGQALDRRADL
ncbi:GDP-mannose 4,6-dehydratase [Paenibacillus sacheonensis]|uniref:NAD-dependent epimerase/dehydratase family protein n=1 Tax=Paenibacillus sacheonensis TaxID=742054 RepID=A0A7X4YTV2_9BACL|nr:GDP-mannose 4,6-dehydratase [Paenibacillus sacheonensis]MBM7568621.1 UDP-glucuronate 4-epimerase [Paenibacillus sacheonensis]NBC72485.1 NAD-dependent epimerase/dehydratase family protein [Paenibacillus sacheonensis]